MHPAQFRAHLDRLAAEADAETALVPLDYAESLAETASILADPWAMEALSSPDARTTEEIAADDYIAAETAREVLLDLPARPGVIR